MILRTALATTSLLFSIAIIGCSEGDAPSAPNEQAVPSAIPQRVQRAPAAPAPAVANAQPAQKKPTVKQATNKKPRKPAGSLDRLLASTDPDDMFSIVKDQPNAGIIPADKSAANQFIAYRPTTGSDFSRVDIVPPAGSASNQQRTPTVGIRRRPTSVLPDGFAAVEAASYTDNDLPRQIRCEKDGSIMVLIPGGVGVIGMKNGPAQTRPQHAVEFDPYYIDIHETTVLQYDTFIEAMKAAKGRQPDAALNMTAAEQMPILGAAWTDAFMYARWSGKDLPTEAEWEFAARGPKSFTYPWGEGRAVWSHARQPGEISEVMSYPADKSPFGVFDMAGNAREWCADYYADDAYEQAEAAAGVTLGKWEGPRHPSTPHHRVVRGEADGWKLWVRNSENANAHVEDIGMRFVLRVKLPD